MCLVGMHTADRVNELQRDENLVDSPSFSFAVDPAVADIEQDAVYFCGNSLGMCWCDQDVDRSLSYGVIVGETGVRSRSESVAFGIRILRHPQSSGCLVLAQVCNPRAPVH